jgi:hypothetical protein
MEFSDDEESRSSGTSDTIHSQHSALTGVFVGDRDYNARDAEAPSSPEGQKKVRPSRACDNCRRKKVGKKSQLMIRLIL